MAIQLLLLKDVEPHGRSGDIISVKPGYARNFLVPMGFAVKASPQALKQQAKLKADREKQAIADKAEAESMAAKVTGLSIETIVKVDHDGHMYGSVSAVDIVHLLQSQHGLELDKKCVHLKHPIKEVGVFEVPLRLKEGVESALSLKVVPEEHK